ncbi:MAG: nuclear transport factor 2 family protein [Marinirhabdus sp.]|nr:nuclear transport factor 2 family protein [Marinirhabdus sp.]
MKKIILLLLLTVATVAHSQNRDEKSKVERACLNYLEGFYEGDTEKLKASLQPNMYKFGFFKARDAETYGKVDQMTFEQALAFARNVKEKEKFPGPGAPKEVTIFEVGNTIASAKVKAWWGIDYLLLSKQGDRWMIEQVLWEGPLQKPKM